MAEDTDKKDNQAQDPKPDSEEREGGVREEDSKEDAPEEAASETEAKQAPESNKPAPEPVREPVADTASVGHAPEQLTSAGPDPESSDDEKKAKGGWRDWSKWKRFLTPRKMVIGLGALVLIAGGTAAYFYSQANQNPEQADQKEVERLVADIGKLIVLPDDEEPVVATVVDPERLKGQAFFELAQEGDKVLIYNNARKAVLFRPDENRIINVAPLNISPSAEEESSEE